MTTPTTITRLLLVALVAGVAAETTGCAPTGTSSRAVVPDGQAAVRIQNESDLEARIFGIYSVYAMAPSDPDRCSPAFIGAGGYVRFNPRGL